VPLVERFAERRMRQGPSSPGTARVRGKGRHRGAAGGQSMSPSSASSAEVGLAGPEVGEAGVYGDRGEAGDTGEAGGGLRSRRPAPRPPREMEWRKPK